MLLVSIRIRRDSLGDTRTVLRLPSELQSAAPTNTPGS